MSEHSERLSEVMFFAGPNGSGKSTITGMAKIVGQYINADDIKRASLCIDLEAAQKAEQLRREMLNSLPYDPERKITPRITEAPGVKM